MVLVIIGDYNIDQEFLSCSSIVSTESDRVVYSCYGRTPVPLTVSTSTDFPIFWAQQVQLILYSSIAFTSFTAPGSPPASSASSISSIPGSDSASATADVPPLGTEDTSKPALSAGAIAGIVIGAVALILLAAAFLFFCRWKQRRQAISATLNPRLFNEASLPELVTPKYHIIGQTQTYKRGSNVPSSPEMTIAYSNDIVSQSGGFNSPTLTSSRDVYTPTLSGYDRAS
ncbi:hypothetical protein EJ02DRAFT_227599 [Clathrospora elynae]|uniref:Uncharacterized protein n=1 Tax=Clathrospora elynae TaxID=706981 RepID=A0A6A5SLL9_9PLEO|nr:hypothetical protein EJ02DRAFT_227599 [Clathrospora elynae]